MLKDRIENDLLAARKAKDTPTIKTLQVLKAQMENEAIKLKHELTDSEVLTVLRRELKQITASIDGAKQAKRQDLLDLYTAQYTLLSEYLPKMKSESEVLQVLQDNGVVSGMPMKDIMAIVKSLNDSTIDNRMAASIAKEL